MDVEEAEHNSMPIPVIEMLRHDVGGGRLQSILDYELSQTKKRVSTESDQPQTRAKTMVRPSSLMTDFSENEPLAKRRHFAGSKFDFSPKPTYQGRMPPTPQAPARVKKNVGYNSRSVSTTRASTLYANVLKESSMSNRPLGSRGRLFMGSTQMNSSSSLKPQRLFFCLGQNLYVDKYADKAKKGQWLMRLSLWHTNTINKLQRSGSRYSILLDYDAIHQIKKEAEDIKIALSLCDDENFVGFALPLGGLKFLTVEPDMCHVNLRHWYKPAYSRDDPVPDLKPCREGIRMTYEQFKKFIDFLDVQMTTEFPNFKQHVFICDRLDHDAAYCPMCTEQGKLPIEREFERLLDDW